MEFVEDAKIQQIAEAYALDAVDFARQNFRLTLDWSDASVAKIESMLDDFDRNRGRAANEDAIVQFGKMFGSYIGETYRKNHGGSWGLVSHEGHSFPGMQGPRGNLFWPWGKVQNRMTNGPEDNVWHYYQHLTRPPE
jgi:hypothetical protein